VTPLSIRKSWH